MHVLFVHKNFPAQFGHVASHLVQELGWECTFVSETPPGTVAGIRKIQYGPQGGATERTHYFARTFENAVTHAAGVYEALEPLRAELVPDLVVGHSGFGSTLFLPELWPEAPIVGYFEWFYHPHGSDLDFRPEWPPAKEDILRSRARNAMIMLDLETCRAGYTPTEYQKSRFPAAYAAKIRVIHDGIDTGLWRRREDDGRLKEALGLDPEAKIVTYVSRGLESMRGFDIFMRVANRICGGDPRAVCLIVGEDRIAYGGDLKHVQEGSFKEHVLARDDYDLTRIRFLGQVAPTALAEILGRSDLHIYLTVPFVLSWSLLNAMASGCVVLASDTAPVREVVCDGKNGLLRDFFDVEGLAETALLVLADVDAHRHLGRAAAETVRSTYSLEVTLPRLADFYEEITNG